MRWAAITLLILCLGMPLGSTTRADEWGALRAAAQTTSTLSADFVQEKHLKILARPLISKGRLLYRTPADIRWEYLFPVKSLMLARKDKVEAFLWTEGRWTPDFGQSLEARRMVTREIKQWIAGDFNRNTAFTAVYHPGPPIKITLSPKADIQNFIKRVELTFGSTPGVIESIEIFEEPEGSTTMAFKNVLINGKLPDGVFEQP